MDICVVLLCNKAYYSQAIQTYTDLRTRGEYTGPVCLVIGNDMIGASFPSDIIVCHFPDWVFPDWFHTQAKALPRPDHWYPKIFQFHKFHLFDVFFKQWKYIFYLDSGIKIYQPIAKMLALARPHTLLAHSDAYPYALGWTLANQFCFPKDVDYPLDGDYPQTTILLYDTALCGDTLPKQLYDLTLRCPSVLTNDQGIIALYFTQIVPAWQQIPLGDEQTLYYDFFLRDKTRPYVMVKRPWM